MADNNYPLNQAQDDIDNLQSDVSDLQSETSDLEQGLIPIAGVTAWHKSLTSESLPDRFVECNGQTISDADSPLDGQSVPDLNGNNRILKGNSSSGGTGSFDTNGDNTSNTENTFDVVWVMRIK